MMRVLTLACAVGLTLTASGLPGAAVSSYGTETCGAWLQSRGTALADHRQTNAWMFGYVEGTALLVDANRQINGLPASKMLDGVDDATVLALVQRFCARRPEQTVGEVLAAVTAQLLASDSTLVHSRSR